LAVSGKEQAKNRQRAEPSRAQEVLPVGDAANFLAWFRSLGALKTR
jgi:hypothetical protein